MGGRLEIWIYISVVVARFITYEFCMRIITEILNKLTGVERIRLLLLMILFGSSVMNISIGYLPTELIICSSKQIWGKYIATDIMT